MLRTISVGNHVYIQGIFEKDLPSGRILVRVGERLYEGFPVQAKAAA